MAGNDWKLLDMSGNVLKWLEKADNDNDNDDDDDDDDE